MDQEPDRRSIFAWAIFGLLAIFNVIIGVPIICYAIDPRHRKGPKSNFKLIEGVKLDDPMLTSTPSTPMQGVIRDVRVDGWTLYPNDVIGRVWVVRVGERPADVTNLTAEQKKAYLLVFTTICPHLGCSVNLDGAGTGFACPCHNATFKRDGERATDANPALRGMDTLEWEFDETDPLRNRITVKYQNFVTSIREKKTNE